MPTLQDYEALAPFTLEELVEAVNSLLRDRPPLRIQPRTVRYYISKGLVPPPSGAPRFARYGMDHLRRIIQLRVGLDQGLKLAEMDASEARQAAPRGPSVSPAEPDGATVQESGPTWSPADYGPVGSSIVKRFRLTKRSTWDVDDDADLTAEIQDAMAALSQLFMALHDGT